MYAPSTAWVVRRYGVGVSSSVSDLPSPPRACPHGSREMRRGRGDLGRVGRHREVGGVDPLVAAHVALTTGTVRCSPASLPLIPRKPSVPDAAVGSWRILVLAYRVLCFAVGRSTSLFASTRSGRPRGRRSPTPGRSRGPGQVTSRRKATGRRRLESLGSGRTDLGGRNRRRRSGPKSGRLVAGPRAVRWVRDGSSPVGVHGSADFCGPN